MSEPILIPIAPALVEALKVGITQEGICRLKIQDDNVLYVEMLHDCFLTQCTHLVGNGQRCADGTYVHNFRGHTRCPDCGFTGIRLGALNDGSR